MIKMLLVFMALLCSVAHADVTLLAGASRFTEQSDGVWYQDAFPHELRMVSPSVGVRWDAPRSGPWGYSLGYMYLGSVSSSALATGIDGKAAGDRGYNPDTNKCNGECGYLSHWYGQGSVQGLYGSAVRFWGNWALEAGLYLYRPTWSVHIPDYVGICRECAPVDLTVTHNPKWQVGPMFGARYQMGKWSVNLGLFHTASEGDEWSSLYHNTTYNLSLGYTF